MILKKQGMIFISFPVNQNRWSENAPKRVKFQKFSGWPEYIPLAKTRKKIEFSKRLLDIFAQKMCY